MNKLLNSKKGFTLVEIVIVIAIIGILAMTLIPAVADTLKSRRLQAATEKARTVANLMVAGIESGQIPTNTSQAEKLGLVKETGEALITEASATPIDKILGIKKIYNDPANNADLKDPMSRDVDLFKVTYENKKISIYGANPDGSANELQLYTTTSELTIFS